MKTTVFGITICVMVPLSGVGLSPCCAAPDSQPADQFTLVYNVNNSGYIDVCGCKRKEVKQGSLTRRASFLTQLRATGRELLLLDGGSAFFKIGKRVPKELRGEAIRKAQLIVESYNRMGYQAMAVGPFDLAAGLDVTRKLEKRAKFPFLSANLFDKDTGKRIFKPHVVFNVNGVRVGVVGLTLATMTRPFLQKVGPNIDARDPMEYLQKSLAELADDNTDVVVLLSHVREETNWKMIDEIPGIQIVVDPYINYGNHHTWIKDPEWLTRRGDSVFLRSDGQGARMGVLDVEMTKKRQPLVSMVDVTEIEERIAANEANEDEKLKLAKWKGFNSFYFQKISLEPHFRTDPGIDLLVEEWKKNVDPSKIAEHKSELRPEEYLTASKCAKCHQTQHDWWKKTKHSTALASLARTGDHQRFDSIGCHTRGYGKAFLDTTNVGQYANVQCESCHGTNVAHAADPHNNPYRKITRQDCIWCHNKEQTLKNFPFLQSRRLVACPSSKS